VAALITVLERATEPARFQVSAEEVEDELARVRPRLQPRRERERARPRLALAFGAVAVAAVAVLVFTFLRLPGTDVEAKALKALGGGGTILKIRERIEPVVPGTFPVSTRDVWLDLARGLELSVQASRGRQVEEMLVEPGRFSRYLPGERIVVVGSSCRAFASGCAEVVDPVAFYRRVLEAQGVEKTKREGGVYLLTLPVQTLPDAVRIEQRVTIDAKTFLPTAIEWREQRPGGNLHAFSRIVIESVERFSFDQVENPFHLSSFPTDTRIIQRTVSKEPLHKIGERRLSLSEARRVRPPLLWFGREYQYRPLSRIDEVRWNLGTAYRIRYGRVTVWNYTNVVPPELLASRLAMPSKLIPLGRNVAHFYSVGSHIVTELDLPGRSVSVVSPYYLKEDFIRALRRLKPLK
jgi:hypothetical protein